MLKPGLAACMAALPMLLGGPVWGQVQMAGSASARMRSEPFAAINTLLMDRADALIARPDAVPAPADRKPPASPGTETASTSLRQMARSPVEDLQWLVSPILESRGVPAEMAAVMVVESGGNAAALSARGARGLWQLMPDTARRYGLAVDDLRDDRLDLEKSTAAAARYLSDLHAQFGSWPLALAAYNTGEERVRKAVVRSGSSDFYFLSALGLLPQETRRYVPAVLAAERRLGRSFDPAKALVAAGALSPVTYAVQR